MFNIALVHKLCMIRDIHIFTLSPPPLNPFKLLKIVLFYESYSRAYKYENFCQKIVAHFANDFVFSQYRGHTLSEHEVFRLFSPPHPCKQNYITVTKEGYLLCTHLRDPHGCVRTICMAP